jgi:hypothetical protein
VCPIVELPKRYCDYSLLLIPLFHVDTTPAPPDLALGYLQVCSP